jgi:hypothetical protein
MTSQDHNKALAVAHGVSGLVIALIVIIIPLSIIIFDRDGLPQHRPEFPLVVAGIFLVLFFAALQMLTAYGLLKRRRWARVTALAIAVPVILYFPLGTALAIYTWWFLHTDSAKQLFSTQP